MLHIAFIGAGRMARLHLAALGKVGIAHRVVGVHDRSESAAREFAHAANARAQRTACDLLTETKPDIVHICTPAGTHFDPALQSLRAGAHVYVEKPFVETEAEARTLLDEARGRGLLICAGHQLLRDPAYQRLIRQGQALRPIVQVDSTFNFRPMGVRMERAGAEALAAQLLDVLPHPLYTLVAALEGASDDPDSVRITAVHAHPTELYAQLAARGVVGRLAVSLRGRPVASTLTLIGAGGSLTADFVRAIVAGAANPGTEPLEKIVNPLVEAWQLGARTIASLARRLLRGGDYPGLVELIDAFYRSVRNGGRSPTPPNHLRRVTAIYEELAANVRSAATAAAPTPRGAQAGPNGPVAVVTGARGWLGKAVARDLAGRGYRVRGVSRSPDTTDPNVSEWATADLALGCPVEALAGAAVVVHAAAATSGGYEAHRRNTVDATRHLLRAMREASVRRLVYVSSLSVLPPPRSPWEIQTEATPLCENARPFGAYTWGKCEAERAVWADGSRLGLEVRIVRPGALVDWKRPELPGLVGRRVFGRWHLGFGRPGHPIAVCAVDQAGAAIGWSAANFEVAPTVVNLLDPRVPTRGELVRRFRRHGWTGRIAWVPISLFAVGVGFGRTVAALARGRLPSRLAVWSLLRPRRYDVARSRVVLQAATLEEPLERIAIPA